MQNYSQAGQDQWIYSLFEERNQENCFFLDIGANDGVSISNTLLLEQKGWKGICVEPNREEYKRLESNRKCKTLEVAISNYNGYCGFREAGLLGEIEAGDSHKCITLRELTQESPTVIQYLSLDIEGFEYKALTQFPFDTHIVEAITVEHNRYLGDTSLKDSIYDLLTQNNYVRVKEDVLVDGLFPFEDWYLHKTMIKNVY